MLGCDLVAPTRPWEGALGVETSQEQAPIPARPPGAGVHMPPPSWAPQGTKEKHSQKKYSNQRPLRSDTPSKNLHPLSPYHPYHPPIADNFPQERIGKHIMSNRYNM